MNTSYLKNSLLLLALAALSVAIRSGLTAPSQTDGSGTVEHPSAGFIMQEPDHYAWEVFCKITAPAKEGSTRAGWESWVSAFRLFADPTQYNFDSGEMEETGQTDSGQLLTSVQANIIKTKKERFSPDFPSQFVLERKEDVGLNSYAVDYILKNHLYSQEGQERMVAHGPINFPLGAIEVKTMWVKLGSQPSPTYYCQEDASCVYWGLQSLHLTTKDIPNWFWATFENENNYRGSHAVPFPSTDSWGFRNNHPTPELLALFQSHHVDSNVWTHYRLGGSQVDYTDSAGRPIVRGNNMIEGGLKGTPASQASCMTCHARSTVDQNLDFNLANDRVGAPQASWFYGTDDRLNHVPVNVQRDFVWSLSRAKHEFGGSESIFWSIGNATQLSFKNDIFPLFRKKDIEFLKSEQIDATNRTCVQTNYKTILTQLQDHHSLPVGQPSWSGYLIEEFIDWARQGFGP